MKKQQPSGSDTTTFDIDILERADASKPHLDHFLVIVMDRL